MQVRCGQSTNRPGPTGYISHRRPGHSPSPQPLGVDEFLEGLESPLRIFQAPFERVVDLDYCFWFLSILLANQCAPKSPFLSLKWLTLEYRRLTFSPISKPHGHLTTGLTPG